ncbi:MAG TPA: MFS transporter [Planctomycetota bacterium]|nr:MFS transporter [Planctomycetota bacterium]
MTRSLPAADNSTAVTPTTRIAWSTVLVAAVVMLATLPGRTQGLGLITEPLLTDLHLDRVTYASVNLWATLLGAACCIPAGLLLDRLGLRWSTTVLVVALAAVVWAMSAITGGIVALFLLLLLTRALGQSALSVASITAVGKGTVERVGLAMGVYAVALSILFVIAFVVLGVLISESGWRVAWSWIAIALIVGVAPLTALLLRDVGSESAIVDAAAKGMDLSAAVRTPAFWIFGGGTALYGLVSSGLGLFNEAVLAERGFNQQTFHTFLAVTTLVALIGQLLCGWLSLRWPLPRLLAIALGLYAGGLAGLPLISGAIGLWTIATLMGLTGGIITVIFFAIWSRAFGRRHLGRIQGAAQMLTVLASAIGPLLFAQAQAWSGSYTPVLWSLVPAVVLLAIAALRVRLPDPLSTSTPVAALAATA